MRVAYLFMTAVTLSLPLVGCGGENNTRLADNPQPNGNASRATNNNAAQATRRLANPTRSNSERADVVAMLGDTTLRWADLRELMIEAAGADALSEWAMDKQVERALARENLAISDDDIQREKQVLLDQLSDNPDDATRLLERVRQQRGLGSTRFHLLLRRNAGLRKLVAEDVRVNDAMVQQLYQQRFGERAVARLILLETVGEASRVKTRLEQGESFIDLAVELSIDESAGRGGLLPEISSDDPTFPAAVRDALEKLEPGEVSDAIALDGGFAILRVERKIPPDESVAFESVADELRHEVRLRNERAAMQQRARMLLEDADLSILDTQLNRTWQQRRREMLRQQ